jgi:FkbM family methyltransferase
LNGVVTVNCAASDRNGTIELRVTNADQSSSILPLARHAEIYPSVQQTSVVQVPTKTIDQILEETCENAADFNLLNLDIQGAELMALKGAIEMLPNIEAILCEVNYEELYAGCPMIEEIDAFLFAQGFDRVATATPYHASWGDAFYVRRRTAPATPKAINQFLHEARNTLVNGWLNIPAASLREAWEGATGRAHRHLVQNGVCQLPIADEDDHRVFQLLQDNLKSASKDRRLNLQLATMLYAPLDQLSTEGMPGWLKKSLGVAERQAA